MDVFDNMYVPLSSKKTSELNLTYVMESLDTFKVNLSTNVNKQYTEGHRRPKEMKTFNTSV